MKERPLSECTFKCTYPCCPSTTALPAPLLSLHVHANRVSANDRVRSTPPPSFIVNSSRSEHRIYMQISKHAQLPHPVKAYAHLHTGHAGSTAVAAFAMHGPDLDYCEALSAKMACLQYTECTEGHVGKVIECVRLHISCTACTGISRVQYEACMACARA